MLRQARQKQRGMLSSLQTNRFEGWCEGSFCRGGRGRRAKWFLALQGLRWKWLRFAEKQVRCWLQSAPAALHS